ncbi:MAG: NAD(P)-dependent oxidoreductase [Elusimicrobia bacterium]|nr:NAD(P)-dependent oxidoreductase [Elusimicrobiota bacterium]
MGKPLTSVKKVGITGAAGNIGTTLQKGLCEKYKLRLFDIRRSDPVCDAAFSQIDFADKNSLKGAFDGLDAVIHLAGNPRPDAPRESTYRNNFEATSCVFEEARRAGVKKIVYASSNFYHEAAIGRILDGASKELITLDMPPSPICLYGESKVFGESLGRHMSYFGIQFVALRIGWTVPQDNPALYGGDYMRAVFCSKRDLVQAFDKALQADAGFLAAFVTSNNTHNVFDLAETKKTLGFAPQDNAENYVRGKGVRP